MYWRASSLCSVCRAKTDNNVAKFRETSEICPARNYLSILSIDVGIKDIVPEATDEGYEGFEVLIEKTNSWIKDQSDIISVANMQSVIVRKNEGITESR